MARQSALRLFILWAGVIGLGNSSSVTTSYSPPPLPGPPQTAPAATADQNGFTAAPTAMTNQPTDKVMTTPPINQDPCSYSVEKIDYGLQIQLKNSPGGNFLVSVSEKNHPNINVVEQTFSEQSHDIIGLKPCTEYQITLQRDRGVVCTNQKNKTVATRKTNDMKGKDISYATNSIRILSYTTHWNINCSDVTAKKNIPAESCGNDPKTCCIKVTSDDICTDFTTTFNQPTCPFTDTVHLSAGKFLNLTPEVTTGNPPTINLTLPNNCDLTISYTCGENKSNMAKNLSELEPYKDYMCVGEIKEKGTFIRKTNPVHVDTSCDLYLSSWTHSQTNSSIGLSWKTLSPNCDITQLQPKLTYNCSCSPGFYSSKPHNHKQCNITGLEAYTEYTCEVQTFYDGKPVQTKQNIKDVRTAEGVPDQIGKLTVTVPENNVFIVTCPGTRNFRGGTQREYRATLYLGPERVKFETNCKCHFEFRDLYYSTTYRVEVTAFNGKYYSSPTYKTVDTLFNDKAITALIIILIMILGWIGVVCHIYFFWHRQLREDENTSVWINLKNMIHG